jgi:hypothetical protein
MGLMYVKASELPPLALGLRNHMASRLGMCMEVCITAFACYAQVVEGLECHDDLYIVQAPERRWLEERMGK